MDTMLLCAARLREATEQADVRRFYPKAFWLKSQQSDRFRRIEYIVEDYLSREHTLNGPSGVLGLPAVTFGEPVLVPPGDLLGTYGATLRFNLGTTGSYSEYWIDYPRRRHIPSPHREETTLATQQSDPTPSHG